MPVAASQTPRVLLLIEAARGFDRGLLSGVARYARHAGPWTFYRQPHSYLSRGRRLNIRELRAYRPDGAVCRMDQVQPLKDLGIPLVAYDVNEISADVPQVVSDDHRAGILAAEHLLDLGYRSFSFCGYQGLRWSTERGAAFCQRLAEAGYRADVYPAEKARRTGWAHEETVVKQWLHDLRKPTGMFCANDDRAASLLETLRAAGFSVPEDVSLLGVDDDYYVCELQNPPLSSVRMASDRAGYDAAALLDQMMRGAPPMSGRRLLAPATGVTARQSTSVAISGNPEIRKALTFIRENAASLIRASDVVKATGISHRALNERFQRELGCPLLARITRARIGVIARMLTETELRVNEIARLVGYDDDQHFARYFKRATGMTPLAYRRRYSPP